MSSPSHLGIAPEPEDDVRDSHRGERAFEYQRISDIQVHGRSRKDFPETVHRFPPECHRVHVLLEPQGNIDRRDRLQPGRLDGARLVGNDQVVVREIVRQVEGELPLLSV